MTAEEYLEFFARRAAKQRWKLVQGCLRNRLNRPPLTVCKPQEAMSTAEQSKIVSASEGFGPTEIRRRLHEICRVR